MGRVILKYRNGHMESLKCKDKPRAKEIYQSRPCAVNWAFKEQSYSALKWEETEPDKTNEHERAFLEQMKRKGFDDILGIV